MSARPSSGPIHDAASRACPGIGHRHSWRRLSAFVLALAFLVAQALFGASVRNAAATQPLPSDADWLRLDIDRMSPRLVTSGDKMLSISGTVTNIGDRRISDLVARLQIGQRQGSERELAAALRQPPPSDAAASSWVGLADILEPGRSVPLSIKVPLDGLGLTAAPGVYPLLVNVNGTPAYGGAARLAGLNLLLPVIEPPGTAPPTKVSMLWPIAATEPKVVAAPHNGPVVLSDDELATDIAPGGRLDALVAAASSYRDKPKVFGSLCFAVDPDLLETVQAMSNGYQVRTSSGRVPGSGKEDAARWLTALRKLVSGHCVVQIPYANADLSTLSRVESKADLVGDAVSNGAAILNLLNLEPRQGVLWPDGQLDAAALRTASEAGTRIVIGDPDRLGMYADAGLSAVTGTDLRVLPYDPIVARALAGTAGDSEPTDHPNVATQNGIAALAFRAGLSDQRLARPVLVAPPHGWNASSSELLTLLESLAELTAQRLLEPTPLPEVLTAEVNGDAVLDIADTTNGTVSTAPTAVITALSGLESTAADLQSAMSVDATRQVEPISLIQPLHNAVLRATSTTWRSKADQQAAASVAQEQLDVLRNQVTVTTPSQPVSLASGSSPLPVTLSNALPVAVTVRLNLANSVGLRPARIEDTPLAANSRVGRLIPAEALRSGRFNVDVSLTTPGGTELGSPARLELTSNEFGSVTVVLTATAATALVLLSGRRIYGRMKARKQQEQSS